MVGFALRVDALRVAALARAIAMSHTSPVSLGQNGYGDVIWVASVYERKSVRNAKHVKSRF